MKITAIQASPHKGNTFKKIQEIESLLLGMGEVEFQHIQLREKNLKPCLGCFRCFLEGEGNCPLDDDAAEILEAMDSADAVIFATPVYSMHVSWLMKLFVDRFAFIFHRPRFFGKYTVGVAVTGGVGLKETLDYLKMFSTSWGFRHLDSLGCTAPPIGSTLPAFRSGKDRTAFVTAKLHKALSSNRQLKPTFRELQHFHVMRAVYSRMEDYLPRDFAYWQGNGWFDKGRSYFTETGGGYPVKSLLPRIMAFLVGRMIDSWMRKVD